MARALLPARATYLSSDFRNLLELGLRNFFCRTPAGSGATRRTEGCQFVRRSERDSIFR